MKKKIQCWLWDRLYTRRKSIISFRSWFEWGKNDEIEDAVRNNGYDDESTDAAESDDDIPLASLTGASNQASSNNQGQANNEPAQRVYRWRKRDTIVRAHSFLEEFSEPPLEGMTPLQYFSKNGIVRCCCRTD